MPLSKVELFLSKKVRNSSTLGNGEFKKNMAPPSKVARFSKTAPGWSHLGSTIFLCAAYSFSLHNHVYREKSMPKHRGSTFQKSAPRDTVLQRKVGNGAFSKKGYYFGTLRTLFRPNKGKK